MLQHTRTLPFIAAALAWTSVLADEGHVGHPASHEAHLRLTSTQAATPADEARYRSLQEMVRRELERYRDINLATADGYEPFLPGVPQHEIHYTKRAHGLAALFTFDPAKPTSLLYRRDPSGGYTLTGVMYTAPAWFDEADLDERVPLGAARWHQHVNLCVPGRTHRERWSEIRDGRPVFGPKSPIASEEECEAVGGKFVPRLFGWMVHVEAFPSG